MIALLLALSGPAGATERCGPVQCEQGQACCNDTCGICVPADRDDVACIALHCGWDANGPGSSRPMVAPGAWHPLPLFEVDAQLGFGRGDPGESVFTSGSLRVPLGRMWFVDGHLAREGVVAESADRGMLVRTAVGWNLPTGSTAVHAAILGGFEGRQAAQVEADRPMLAFNARQVETPWVPGVVGGAAVAVGRWPWAASASVRGVLGVDPAADLAVVAGAEGHGDLSADLTSTLPVAIRIGGDVRLGAGGAVGGGTSSTVAVSGFDGRVHIAFDGRVGTRIDARGAVAPLLTGGVRLRFRTTADDLAALMERWSSENR